MAERDGKAERAGPAAKLGGELRAARRALGWEIPQLAESLRIRQPYLEAIESGRVADLPGSTYALGFVRAYASALGLDAETMARRFRDEASEVTGTPALHFPAAVPRRGVPAGALILLGLVVLAGAYVFWYRSTEHRTTPVETVPPIPDRLSSAAAKPAPSPQVASMLPGAAAPAALPQDSRPPAANGGSGQYAAKGGQGPSAVEAAPGGPAAAQTPPPGAGTDAPPSSDSGSQLQTLRQSHDAAARAEEEAAAGMTPPPPDSSGGSASGLPSLRESHDAATALTAAEGAGSTAEPRRAADPAGGPASQDAAQFSALPKPGAAAATAPAKMAPVAVPPGGRIVLRFTGDAWVTVKQKSGPALLNKMMHAGDSFAVPADTTGLSLTTGFAGATEIDVDGTPIPGGLGGGGVVRRDIPLDADLLKSGKLPAPAPKHAAPQPGRAG